MIPFEVLFKITEFMLIMGSSTFVDFIFSYFIISTLMVLERLYVAPLIKTAKRIWPKWKMIVKRKYFGRTIKTMKHKLLEEEEWRSINEKIEFESETIEMLMESFSGNSVDVACELLLPVVQLIFILFYDQVEIPVNYGISKGEMVYFALFSFFMIPWKIAVNVLVLNTQEVLHGLRLHDYIAYQRYRCIMREKRWLMNQDYLPDESISLSKQIVDILCCSDQHFFLTTAFALSMFFNMIGMTVIVRAKHNPLGDPITPIIILMVYVGCKILEHFLLFICNIKVSAFDLRGLWVTKVIDNSIDDLIAAKLTIGEGKKSASEKECQELEALENGNIRSIFLFRNRAWLLQNLEYLLTPRSLRRYNSQDQYRRG